MLAQLKRWWKYYWMDPYEKYLSESDSLEDLERRMKNYSRYMHKHSRLNYYYP